MSCRAAALAGPIAALGLALAIAVPISGQEPDKVPPEAQKAMDAVRAAVMPKQAASKAQIHFENAAVLAKVFPEHYFIVVRFRPYPVAQAIPAGMKPSNVFAVTRKEQEVRPLKDAREMEAFFKASQVPADSEAAARKALAAWLTLAQALHQDGLFKFEVLDRAFEYTRDGNRQVVRGRAVVTQGGKGEIDATLEYEQGKLTKVATGSKITASPRR